MITVAFSTHRLEVLPEAHSLMARHDVIALEEPPQTGFDAMLKGGLSIDQYLESSDYEFPEFARRSCLLYRELYGQGKRFLQVDPYMEHLQRLHDFFAEGGDVHAIDPTDAAYAVYRMESQATAALMHFYARSMSASLASVVPSVIAFAQADAARIALRDRMRAEALASVAEDGVGLYVECGYIHWSLFLCLHQLVGSRKAVRPCFVLEEEARRRIGKKQVLGPGDRLTLLLLFHPNHPTLPLQMLAAQSLIYVKLLHKEEMIPDHGSYPHLDDEAQALRCTRRLSWTDCQVLWPLVRRSAPAEAQSIVQNYLEERSSS